MRMSRYPPPDQDGGAIDNAVSQRRIDRPDRSPTSTQDAEPVAIIAAGALAFRESRIGHDRSRTTRHLNQIAEFLGIRSGASVPVNSVPSSDLSAHDIEQDADLSRVVGRRIGLEISFEWVDRLTQKLGLNAKHPQVSQLGGFVPIQSDEPALDG